MTRLKDRKVLGEHSESAEEDLELVTYEFVKVNLYMWTKVTTYNCGTEFLSPAHHACAVTNFV